MIILLDENILEGAREYLIELGHDVESIKSMGLSNRGYSDDKVLKLAIHKKAILFTHNGKDFISSIPPRYYQDHYGLIWIRENMTRVNYRDYIDFISSEILEQKEGLFGAIWQVKFKSLENCRAKKIYPKL